MQFFILIYAEMINTAIKIADIIPHFIFYSNFFHVNKLMIISFIRNLRLDSYCMLKFAV